GTQWNFEVVKGDASGKAAKGVIELPYKFISGVPNIASNRGSIIIEFGHGDDGWELKSISQRATFSTLGGKETQIPEDDQQTRKLPDKDYAVKYIRQA